MSGEAFWKSLFRLNSPLILVIIEERDLPSGLEDSTRCGNIHLPLLRVSRCSSFLKKLGLSWTWWGGVLWEVFGRIWSFWLVLVLGNFKDMVIRREEVRVL